MKLLPQWRWQTRLRTPQRMAPRGARVRRALSTMLVVYLLVNALLGVGIQTNVVNIRDALYTHQLAELKKLPQFWGPSPKTRILALGSSRTQQAFDPETFMQQLDVEAYNFAVPGAGGMANAIYLRRLFSQGLQTEYLVIEWHPGFTAKPNHRNGMIFENGWLFDNRLEDGDFDLLNSWGNPRPKPNSSSWYWYANTFVQFRLELVNKYSPTMQVVPLVVVRDVNENYRGYAKGFPHSATDYEVGINTVKRTYSGVFDNYHLGGPGWNALQDMIAVTRSYGVKPIVVLSAESKDVQALYGDEANQELAAALKQFDCPVINARDWVPKEGTSDGHHLTVQGAQIYTKKLAEALKPYLGTP